MSQQPRGPEDLRTHKEFGRDGITGLVTPDRSVRAREVSRPTADDHRAAAEVLAGLLARVEGRR